MDNQNEKDIKGQSKSEGESPKDDIPLWLQGLEDPDLEDTSQIYPQSDVEDKWIKELSGESPENNETFSSLEDDIRSDNVLPDWLSELSKVDPSPPDVLDKQEDEKDLDIPAEHLNNPDKLLDDTTEEIEIGQIRSEKIVDSEVESIDNDFTEISDMDFRESSESEDTTGNSMAAEETLPYWLRDMITEPPKPTEIEVTSPTIEAEKQIPQDEPSQGIETESEAPSEQSPEPKLMEVGDESDQDAEVLEKEPESEIASDSKQVDETSDDQEVHPEPDLSEETLEAEGGEVEVGEAEATKIEASVKETIINDAKGFETSIPDLPEQSQEITKPIKVNLEEPSEEPEQFIIESEEVPTKEQGNGSKEADPDNLDEQQRESAEIETIEAQEQVEDIGAHKVDETEGQLDETAQITTNGSEDAQEDAKVEKHLEEPESVIKTRAMNIEEQPDVIPPPDPNITMGENLLTAEELMKPDSSLEPEMVETDMEIPPEHEIPMTLDDAESETIKLPQSVSEKDVDLPSIDKSKKVQPSEMPKTLLFARYLLEQGDIESATQVLGPYIEGAKHLEEIQTWLIESAKNAARTSSFVWEMIGDIAMAQDDPIRAFESYSKAIDLLLQTKKEFDETH